MTIVELNFERSWRGGEQQTLYNIQGFLQKGFEVELVCRKGSALEKRALVENITVHSFNSILGVFFFLITKASRFAIMHAQGSKILTYCILSKPFHRSKIIFTRRVNFIQAGFFTKLKYRLTDKIVAISSSVKNMLSAFTSRTDIEIISDVVVENKLNKDLADAGLKNTQLDNKHIIATIAALTLEKNPFDTIKAIKLVKEKRTDVVFLHFGEGVLMEEMKQLIIDNDLSDTYFLMGFVENVTDYFSAFEIFIMNSNNEGLCSSVLDAFVYKVPVVSTTAGGLSDLIKEDRATFCEINNPSMMADKIDFLIQNPASVISSVNNAYNYVLQNHSAEHIAQQYAELINTMLNPASKI